MAIGEYISTSEAAVLLGVSERRLQAMAEEGMVSATKISGRYLFERSELEDLSRIERRDGRPLAPRTIWMVLLHASGERVPRGIGRGAKPALDLLRARGLIGLRHDLRHRGERRAFRVHPGVLDRLRDSPELVLSGISAAHEHGLGLGSSGEVEAYVRVSDVEDLTTNFALTPSSDGPVVMRAVEDDAWMLSTRFAPIAAVALDLADARDARSVEVGRRCLESLSAYGPAPAREPGEH